MGDDYRFGTLERFVLGGWVFTTTAFIVVILNEVVPAPAPSLVTAVQLWVYLGALTVYLILFAPFCRPIYRRRIQPRLPKLLASN